MDLPETFETVWFYTPNYEGSAEQCKIWDRSGWQLGWYDGQNWISYSCEKVFETAHVREWASLRLPNEQKRANNLRREVKKHLHSVN